MINQIVAYICVIVIALHAYIRILLVQEGAVWALGYILLNGFFTMTHGLAHKRQRQSFNNIVDARKTILACARDAYRRDKHVEVEWLGMTMQNVWSILPLIFDDLRENNGVKALHLKVAMLKGDWLSENIVNPAWTQERAHTSMINMLTYFEGLARKGFSEATCEISCYSHMPGIHGGLINGKYLFLGVCQWEDGNLQAGECQYYLYTFKDIEDVKKIEIFQKWFQYCSSRGSTVRSSAPVPFGPSLRPSAATA